MSHSARALELMKPHVGQDDGFGDWLEIDQARIDAFAVATLDDQFIHVDPHRAATESPYGTTIAHGFLTLSLVVHLGSMIPQKSPDSLEGLLMGVNYGLDKVRFPSPVLVGSRVRAHRRLAAIEQPAPATIQRREILTVEIEDVTKPACVVEMLTRLIYSD